MVPRIRVVTLLQESYNRVVKANFEGVEGPATHTGQRFKFRLDDGTRILVFVDNESGRVVFRSVEVVGNDVTPDTLRSFRIGDLRRQVHEILRGWPSLLNGQALLAELYRGSGHDVPESLNLAEKKAAAAVEGGLSRVHIDDEFLRNFAIEWIKVAGVRGARDQLARRFYCSSDTVARWVLRARREGWLAKTTPGRLGAKPGPKLLNWQEGEVK